MKIFTWKQRIVVLLATLGPILLFCGMGYFIGRATGNWKIGIVVGALLSYPFTQFAVVKSIQKLYGTESKDNQE